jgi:hypothetical protein
MSVPRASPEQLRALDRLFNGPKRPGFNSLLAKQDYVVHIGERQRPLSASDISKIADELHGCQGKRKPTALMKSLRISASLCRITWKNSRKLWTAQNRCYLFQYRGLRRGLDSELQDRLHLRTQDSCLGRHSITPIGKKYRRF